MLLRVLAAVTLVTIVAVACSASSSKPVEPPPDVDAPAPDPAVRPDKTPLNYGPRSPEGLQAILGTADLGVGRSRFGFVLTSSSGFVTAPVANVTSRYYSTEDAESVRKETLVARYQPWPYGNRGLYTVWLDFDRQGSWGVDIEVKGLGDAAQTAQLFFDVAESTSAPAVGAGAVRSITKTVADVESLAQLTTGSLRDEDLYQMTIAGAVNSGRPTVVVFASPAFCTNAVCGPQVEVLQELKGNYAADANFVHVDFYDNPHEIQGDLTKARLSPAVFEWGLPSIEWTFVIDGDGIVTARFEAFATYAEVEQALRLLL
jgi:hypothetical protein